MVPDGRGERIRTSDPLLPKQMRYLAALLPDGGFLGLIELIVNRQKATLGEQWIWFFKDWPKFGHRKI